MPVKRTRSNIGYGLSNALQTLAPLPIVANRAPTANDTAEIGTNWIDTTNDSVYTLTSIVAGSANWATAPSSGATILASLEVTTTSHLIGAVTADSTLDVTGATTLGDLTVAGTLTFTGDLDLTSAALIDLTSTLDAAPSIYLHANGGTSEQILLRADQGTSADSVSLLSDVGGITIQATGSAAAAAIDINANTGGITLDAAKAISITSTVTGASAIVLNSTIGGVDILASGASAGEDINLTATGSSINLTSTENAALAVYLHANGGTSETIRLHSDQGTGAGSINLLSDVGGIQLTATGLVSATAIDLSAPAGGVRSTSALKTLISSTQSASDAIELLATAGGILITASGAAAGEDITLSTTGSSISLIASEAAADAIVLNALDAAGGIQVLAGTAGVDFSSVLGDFVATTTIDAADAIYLHANGGTSETIRLHADQGTGVASVALVSDVGGITLTSGLASADAINLAASAGGVDIDGALQVNIASSQNAVDAIVINASAGGIDITAAGAATEDIDIVCTAGSVNITGGEAAADAITIQSSNAAGGVQISSGTGDLVLTSTGNIFATSTLNAADAIYLRANAGTGEKIRVHADQGTGLDSVSLVSDVGGITLSSGALAATTGVALVQGAATANIQVGAGAPSHNSPKGSLYLRTDGSGVNDRAYIATDAVGTWTAVVTVA